MSDKKKCIAIAIIALILAISAYTNVSTLVTTAANTSNATTNLYTNRTIGNDGYLCVNLTYPCLTIQGAYNKIPATLYGSYYIYVGNGTYPESVTIGGKTPVGQPNITIIGQTRQLEKGSWDVFTVGSLYTNASFQKNGAGWAVNQYRGKWVYVQCGNIAQCDHYEFHRVISNNSETAISLVGAYFDPVWLANNYIIYDSNSTISGDIQLNPSSAPVRLMNLNINGIGGSAERLTLIGVNQSITGYTQNTYELVSYDGYHNYYNVSNNTVAGLWFSTTPTRIHESFFYGNALGVNGSDYHWGILGQSGGQQIIYCGSLISNFGWGA